MTVMTSGHMNGSAILNELELEFHLTGAWRVLLRRPRSHKTLIS